MSDSPNPMAVRFNAEDRSALRQVADHLQRTQVDTLRLLVRSARDVIKEHGAKPTNPPVQTTKGKTS